MQISGSAKHQAPHRSLPAYSCLCGLAGLKNFVARRRTGMTNDSRSQTSSQSVRPGNGRTHEPEGVGSRPASASRDPVDRSQSMSSTTIDHDSTDPPSLRTPGVPECRETLEPLTISLPSPLVRQARIVVVALGTTMSKLVTGLLEEAVARELPAIVAELSGSGKAAK